MDELASIEVEMFHTVLAACKYHRNIESMCESCFVVDSPTSSILSLREISNNKA